MTIRTAEDATTTPTHRVVNAIAEETDADATSLTPPLGSVVDPEALNRLVGSADGTDVTVTFEYAGHEVSLSGDDLTVDGLEG